MEDRTRVLAATLASLAKDRREAHRSHAAAVDRAFRTLAADLVAARTAIGMTQEDVAGRMGTKKSAISRLESGFRTRPTLRTIEKYARAVGASVEIRVRAAR